MPQLTDQHWDNDMRCFVQVNVWPGRRNTVRQQYFERMSDTMAYMCGGKAAIMERNIRRGRTGRDKQWPHPPAIGGQWTLLGPALTLVDAATGRRRGAFYLPGLLCSQTGSQEQSRSGLHYPVSDLQVDHFPAKGPT